MQLLIMSDIHGNVSALNSVLSDAATRFHPVGIALLGDNIDYGMRSNEVISILKGLRVPVLCSLWGNHEFAILTENYSHFSAERGVQSAKRTRKTLTKDTLFYLQQIPGKEGHYEFQFAGRKFLGIHGNRDDCYWGCIMPGDDSPEYAKFDYVLSGHTHCSHAFSQFYHSAHAEYRKKKRTVFINPGSVGQPRNHDPHAQYAVLDTGKGVYLCGVEYDIGYEQGLFTDEVDCFYKDRLKWGI